MQFREKLFVSREMMRQLENHPDPLHGDRILINKLALALVTRLISISRVEITSNSNPYTFMTELELTIDIPERFDHNVLTTT